MSDKKDEEEYSTGTQVGLIIGLYILSLAISIGYNIRHVSFTRTSKIIFILSALYASFFVYLNIMAIFDLFFNNRTGFKKLFKFLKRFYFGFGIVDIALGFFLFNVLIYYLESGFYSKWKRFTDGVRRFIYSILKLTKKEIIIIIAIAVPLITVILALLIKYRKHFDLGNNPIEYTNILFDCYAVFEIYTGVGFFIYQLIKDYKIRGSDKLGKRYYRYSTCKIIDKTKKYLGKIDNAYNHLNALSPVFENDKSNPYYEYLHKEFEKIKQTKNDLGNISVNEGNSVAVHNNINESNNNNNNNTTSPIETNNNNNNVE